MFTDKMVTPAIPERVFALCKAVSNRKMLDNELREYLEPSDLGGKTPYYGMVRNAAIQLGLITMSDNSISLAVDKKEIKNITSMRRYINVHFSNIKEGMFYDVTKEYINLGTDVLVYDNVSKMCDLFGEITNRKIDEDNMRAWRFWASFLGFGYLHDMIILPNAGIFLRDIIDSLDLKKNTELTMEQFMELIGPYCDVILNNIEDENKFNYAMSNGLRMLHDQNYIHLEHKLDRGGMFFLTDMEFHEIKSTVNNIVIRG